MNSKVKAALIVLGAAILGGYAFSQVYEGRSSLPAGDIRYMVIGLDSLMTWDRAFMAGRWLVPAIICGAVALLIVVVSSNQSKERAARAEREDLTAHPLS
jgi:hypothetical protein